VNGSARRPYCFAQMAQRVCLTMAQKAKVLERIDKKVSYAQIEEEFNIGRGTITGIKH
jgi:hypothetical protein